MSTLYDIAIIGAGPAGMMSAIYAKRANKKVLLIDKFTPGGRVKSTYQVDNYLGFGKVNAHELVSKMIDHLHDLGIQESCGLVSDITKNSEGIFELTIDDVCCEALAVIVATGTTPKPLNVENEEKFLARGVSYCAVCDAMFFENEDVVMIGGGDSALEESLFLSETCKSVTIIHELDKLTASPAIIQKVENRKNIHVIHHSTIVKFDGLDELENVVVFNQLSNQEMILTCSGAFIYVGNQADTRFLSHLILNNETGYINVTPEMKTSIDGLFACGDVTKKDYRFIVTAISDGAIASLSAVKYLDEL